VCETGVVGRRSLKDTAMKWILTLLREEHAATAVEYSVMLALILVAIIGAIATVGAGTGGMFSNNQAQLQAAGFGS
jgi:Flp pilus assembly pilin Flp